MHWLVRLWDNDLFHWAGSLFFGVVHFLYSIVWRLTGGPQSVPYWQDWQSRPLAKFPLPKIRDDIPVDPSYADNCGGYLVTMIVTYVPFSLLAPLLPKRLGWQPSLVVDNRHPIFYMFGYTQHLHTVWFPNSGFGYLEFAVGIPNLTFLGCKKGFIRPFVYVPVLYLRQRYPIFLGKIVGYNKKLREMDTSYEESPLPGIVTSRYSIYTQDKSKEIVRARFTTCAQSEEPPVGEHLDRWKLLSEQPQINSFLGGTFLCLHYHLAWPDGIVQPCTADVDVFEDDGIPGLKPGHYSWPGINIGKWVGDRWPEGAFRLSTPFELLSPFARSGLDGWHPGMDDDDDDSDAGTTGAGSANSAAGGGG